MKTLKHYPGDVVLRDGPVNGRVVVCYLVDSINVNIYVMQAIVQSVLVSAGNDVCVAGKQPSSYVLVLNGNVKRCAEKLYLVVIIHVSWSVTVGLVEIAHDQDSGFVHVENQNLHCPAQRMYQPVVIHVTDN